MSAPLAGCRVVVCRPADQAGELVAALAASGAEPVPFPLLEVAAPLDGGAALAAAVDHLDRYRWVLLTSANGVRSLRAALADRRWPPGVALGTVGPATTAAARSAGWPVELARPGGTGADLAAAVGPAPAPGANVLLAVAELAAPGTAQALRAAGWEVDTVTAYRTVTPTHPPQVRAVVAGAHAVVFTSPSTVDRFVEAVPRVPPVVVCIGPTTAGRVADHGLAVTAVAAEQSDAGVVAALASVWGGPPPRGAGA